MLEIFYLLLNPGQQSHTNMHVTHWSILTLKNPPLGNDDAA